MDRRLLAVVLAGSALLGVACGSGNGSGNETSSGGRSETTAADISLPKDSTFVDVTVTRPRTNQAVDVDALPPTGRPISRMTGLTDDERACANTAIKATLDADPGIDAVNARMGGLLGNAVVACTSPERLAAVLADNLQGADLLKDPKQRPCLETVVRDDLRTAGRFLSALLVVDVPTVLQAAKPFAERCQLQLDQ